MEGVWNFELKKQLSACLMGCPVGTRKRSAKAVQICRLAGEVSEGGWKALQRLYQSWSCGVLN